MIGVGIKTKEFVLQTVFLELFSFIFFQIYFPSLIFFRPQSFCLFFQNVVLLFFLPFFSDLVLLHLLFLSILTLIFLSFRLVFILRFHLVFLSFSLSFLHSEFTVVLHISFSPFFLPILYFLLLPLISFPFLTILFLYSFSS